MSSKRAKKKAGNGAGDSGATQPRLHTILYSLAALVALAGVVDATYLTIAHLAGEHVACGGSTQCDQVLSSKYASVFGVPLAAIGGVAYFAAFSFATLAAFAYMAVRRWLAITVALMFLGTLWLLYVQAFVLRAYCTYCLLSAACTFILAGILLAIPPRRSQG